MYISRSGEPKEGVSENSGLLCYYGHCLPKTRNPLRPAIAPFKQREEYKSVTSENYMVS